MEPSMYTSDEKSSTGQAPPPSYPGYPPPGQGFVPPQYGGAGHGQTYPAQPAAVTIQPAVYVTRGPLADPANDYLGYSIFTMLCCCLPLGIAALIYSISTRDANHAGDQIAAERNSRTARILNHVALGVGLGFIILTVTISLINLNY